MGINGRKITYVANTDWALYNFRKGLVEAMVEDGWNVSGICCSGEYWDKLRECGLNSLFKINSYVKGIHPWHDLSLLVEFYCLYRRMRPDIVHHFTIKPVIYGSLAAHLAGIPLVVNTITGMGYMFVEGRENGLGVQRITMALYRAVRGISDVIFFQNKEDMEFFRTNRLVTMEKAALIPGSGVNVDFFSPQSANGRVLEGLREELQIRRNERIILCVSRMLYDKGIAELVRCANELRKKRKDVRFILVGPLAPGNPSMILKEEINRWVRTGNVEYLGRRSEIRELMLLSDIVVLPSYYREGVPRALLEAAAMGKAIVTTDTAGCRDIVRDGKNGFLVPPKDPDALRLGIEKLIQNDTLRAKMGEKSRKRAVNHFDEKIIIQKSMEVYETLLSCHLPRIMDD